MKQELLNKVQAMFGLDTETINQVIFEVGCKHSERYGEDALAVRKSKPYWNWWKNVFETNTKRIIARAEQLGISNVEGNQFERYHTILINSFYLPKDEVKQLVNHKNRALCQK